MFYRLEQLCAVLQVWNRFTKEEKRKHSDELLHLLCEAVILTLQQSESVSSVSLRSSKLEPIDRAVVAILSQLQHVQQLEYDDMIEWTTQLAVKWR